jgi:chitosanase
MNASVVPFDPRLIAHIRRVLSVAETGKPEWNPSAVYIYSDDNRFNPARKQITLSIGFTEGGGNLKKVLARYITKGGALGPTFAPYMANLGAGASLWNDSKFVQALKDAGKEPAMIMVQSECFDEFYLEPAFKWAASFGFTLPLSYLVIADSFLHSGSMLAFLMNAFAEKKPSAGGNEKVWIKDYLNARKKWLAGHSNKILNGTVYRANCFLAELARDNWNLDKSPVVMNGVKIELA